MQLVTLAAAAAVLAVWLCNYHRARLPLLRRLMVGSLAWAAHIVCFYALVVFQQETSARVISNANLNIWSSAIRLQGLLTLLSLGLALRRPRA